MHSDTLVFLNMQAMKELAEAEEAERIYTKEENEAIEAERYAIAALKAAAEAEAAAEYVYVCVYVYVCMCV